MLGKQELLKKQRSGIGIAKICHCFQNHYIFKIGNKQFRQLPNNCKPTAEMNSCNCILVGAVMEVIRMTYGTPVCSQNVCSQVWRPLSPPLPKQLHGWAPPYLTVYALFLPSIYAILRLFQARLDTFLHCAFFASLSVHGLHVTAYALSKRHPQN